MRVQGRLIQARFIEIHQVFEKKKFGSFSNRVVYSYILVYHQIIILSVGSYV